MALTKQILRGYVTITASSNDTIEWWETGGYDLSITLAAGDYYPDELATIIEGEMLSESAANGAGATITFSVSSSDGTVTWGSDTSFYPKLTTTETGKFLTGGDQSAGEQGDNHFGFTVDSAYPGAATSFTSDTQHANAWYPSQPKKEDDEGNLHSVAIESKALDGTTKIYDFGDTTRGAYTTLERRREWEYLTTADRNAYETELWWPHAKSGDTVRVIEDSSDLDTYTEEILIGESLRTPAFQRTRPGLPRWNLTILTRRLGGTVLAPRLHDTTHSPIGLFQFDGDITNSGSGSVDFTHNSGTLAYGTAYAPGYQCLDAQGDLDLSLTDSNFKIAGDLTIEMMLYPHVTSPYPTVVQYGGPAFFTEADNIQYSIVLDTTGSPSFRFYHEYHNPGYNDNFYRPAYEPVANVWKHIAYRRESNVLSLFVNGVKIANSGTLSAPTGGTNATLQVANASGAYFFDGLISSLKIVDSALTDAQIAAEASRCLGVSLA